MAKIALELAENTLDIIAYNIVSTGGAVNRNYEKDLLVRNTINHFCDKKDVKSEIDIEEASEFMKKIYSENSRAFRSASKRRMPMLVLCACLSALCILMLSMVTATAIIAMAIAVVGAFISGTFYYSTHV